jgi:ferrous iron transport protein B
MDENPSHCACPGCERRGACAPRSDAPQRDRDHAWLDRLFLHPRWGFAGSILVFAAVLFVVFELSAWIDSMTTARLAEWASTWRPASTAEVVAKAVADGLIGLAGIVLPYMIPLVLLLVALEQAGLMQRIAIVIDRAFHRIGLHGATAVSFLTGLGCNVPAISSAARFAEGRERTIASLLITFVPCSARSAIILAIAGKYLGAAGVFAIFASAMVVIALLGRLMSRRRVIDIERAHSIPPYALPHWRKLLAETWDRSSDVLTIVTPLLVAGSVVLALLQHWGADAAINAVLRPVTAGWLGLPVALGVPLLFGVLRKELSLVMIFQALGTQDVGAVLDAVQLTTLLLFLTFYVPCLSTFAVMLRTLGNRAALQSVALSVIAALAVSGAARAIMYGTARIAGLVA